MLVPAFLLATLASTANCLNLNLVMESAGEIIIIIVVIIIIIVIIVIIIIIIIIIIIMTFIIITVQMRLTWERMEGFLAVESTSTAPPWVTSVL